MMDAFPSAVAAARVAQLPAAPTATSTSCRTSTPTGSSRARRRGAARSSTATSPPGRAGSCGGTRRSAGSRSTRRSRGRPTTTSRCACCGAATSPTCGASSTSSTSARSASTPPPRPRRSSPTSAPSCDPARRRRRAAAARGAARAPRRRARARRDPRRDARRARRRCRSTRAASRCCSRSRATGRTRCAPTSTRSGAEEDVTLVLKPAAGRRPRRRARRVEAVLAGRAETPDLLFEPSDVNLTHERRRRPLPRRLAARARPRRAADDAAAAAARPRRDADRRRRAGHARDPPPARVARLPRAPDLPRLQGHRRRRREHLRPRRARSSRRTAPTSSGTRRTRTSAPAGSGRRSPTSGRRSTRTTSRTSTTTTCGTTTKLAEQVALIESRALNGCYTAGLRIDDEGVVTPGDIALPALDPSQAGTHPGAWTLHSMLLRRDAILGSGLLEHEQSWAAIFEQLFFLYVLKLGRVEKCTTTTFFYREHPATISNTVREEEDVRRGRPRRDRLHARGTLADADAIDLDGLARSSSRTRRSPTPALNRRRDRARARGRSARMPGSAARAGRSCRTPRAGAGRARRPSCRPGCDRPALALLRVGQQVDHHGRGHAAAGLRLRYRCRTYAILKFCHFTAWGASPTQTRQPSRLDVSCEPSKNARWSTPSISRSSGIAAAGPGEQRREHVGLMDELVGRASRGDPAGPPDQAGRAQPALGGREVRAVEDARAAPRDQQVLGAFVAGEHDDRVICDAEFVECVEQIAEVADPARRGSRPSRRSRSRRGTRRAGSWARAAASG